MEQLTYFIITRKIFDSAIWRDDPHILKLFIYLIGMARHDKIPKKYPGFEVKRGELVTSLAQLSDNNEFFLNGRLQKWSRAKVGRMLEKLIEQCYITKLSDTYGTHISICNYDTYQNPSHYTSDTSDTRVLRACYGSVTGVSTNKNANKGKKGNNEEYSTKIDFDTFWELYDKKVGDKTKLKKKWNKLSLEIQTKALEHITEYKTAQQDKQYRKNPDTYLNNKSWNDEIISKDQTQTIRVVTA